MSESVLSQISDVDELIGTSKFLQDANVDAALEAVVKLIMNPEIPSAKAIPLIVKLQAIATVCSIKATWYSTVEKGASGSERYFKKNLYFTLAKSLDEIVQSLKYIARANV